MPELLPELTNIIYNQARGNYIAQPNELQYEVIGTDERQHIADSKIAPFRYICQIRTRVSNGSTSVGTGFFIGPRTILTVAHNVWDEFVKPNGANVTPDKVEIIPARNGNGDSPFGVLKPSSIIFPYTNFKNGDRGGYKDYAIIQVDKPIGLETGFFGMGKWAKDSIGSKSLKLPFKLPCPEGCMMFTIAGYPGDKDNKKSDKQYKSSEIGLRLDGNGRFLVIRNDTYKGMSGGPVWIRRDARYEGRIVVGFLLGPGEKDKNGFYISNVARYIDDDVRNFIIRNYK